MEKIEKSIVDLIGFMFNFVIAIFELVITVIIAFGAIAAFFLLYKMFPDTALLLFDPMFLILGILSKILWAGAITVLILFVILVIVLVAQLIDEREKKMKIRRNKFIDEIVEKLKKGNKKK